MRLFSFFSTQFSGVVLSVVLSSVFSVGAIAQTLDLATFKRQVQGVDPGYRGAELQQEGARKASEAYESVTDLQFLTEAAAIDDRQPTQNPDFQGDRSTVRSVSVGFQKQFLWGPSVKLTQNIVHREVLNALRTAVPEPDYYDTFPQLEVAVPLWRNLFGGQTNAQYESLKAKTESEVLLAEADYVRASSDIELAYYNHLANIEQVAIRKEMLSRAEKLTSWVNGQFGRGLIDKSDVHQADAAVTLRRIELQNAEDALAASARQFNALRGQNSDVVSEKLVASDLPLEELKLNKAKVRARKDLLANEALNRIQEQDQINRLEQMKPQLDLSFKGARTGRDRHQGAAFDESNDGDQDYWFIGLKFTTPIDAPKYIRMRSGFRDMAAGQRLKLQALARDRTLEWQKFADLGARLRTQILLLRELERTQQLKAASEQTRLQRGRSTTFQVLTFEQDFNSARSQRISAELEARRYIAQIPLFREQ